MKLFFDIETSGLPKKRGFNDWFPPKELDKYEESRIIEIGIIIVDKGKIIDTYNNIIKPDNFITLKPKITELTGITDEIILKEGKDINEVIKEILPLFEKVKVINSYNINFDYNVLLSEMYRFKNKEMIHILTNVEQECTFFLSKQILLLTSYKLENVYKALFKKNPKQDHRAYNDAILCKDVYYKLKKVYIKNKKKKIKNKKIKNKKIKS